MRDTSMDTEDAQKMRAAILANIANDVREGAAIILDKLIAQKQQEARIDELERLNTGRHYGKDYQDSLDELDEYKSARLAALNKSGKV